MNYGIYISAEGAMAQSTRMEVLSNNLANVGTTAFKRDLVVAQSRFAEQTHRGLDSSGSRSLNDLGGGVEVQQTMTDFSGGAIKETGNKADLAINGDGFFVVRRGDRELLTRAGNFSFSREGILQTQEGDPVLNDSGEPLRIDPDSPIPWQFSPEGNIQQGADNVPLAMVKPASLGDLVKIGDNLFSPLAPVQPLDLGQRHVISGHLELSGTKPPLEMLDLIQTSRSFEANVNMIRNQDQMYGELLSRVLKS